MTPESFITIPSVPSREYFGVNILSKFPKVKPFIRDKEDLLVLYVFGMVHSGEEVFSRYKPNSGKVYEYD
jgi:hypothetical protein